MTAFVQENKALVKEAKRIAKWVDSDPDVASDKNALIYLATGLVNTVHHNDQMFGGLDDYLNEQQARASDARGWGLPSNIDVIQHEAEQLRSSQRLLILLRGIGYDRASLIPPIDLKPSPAQSSENIDHSLEPRQLPKHAPTSGVIRKKSEFLPFMGVLHG
jgi:hypothetical protein